MDILERCEFCGIESPDLVDEDYYDSIVHHGTLRRGCRDKTACLDRLEQAVKEWRQALKVRNGNE